ncbi:MAG: DegV family protein [Bacillota bacterium]|nr:DegV family protein [Bacillota bacterium]
MSKIRIISDTAGDIRYDSIEKYNIKMLPLNIFFGEELVLDYFDIKYQEFFSRLKSAETVPTTSQVSPTAFYDAYKEAADEGFDTVICFTLSKMGSGTYNNAKLAANMLKEDGITLDVEIIDTMCYSFAYGRTVEIAAEMAANESTKNEILEKTYSMLKSQTSIFAVDTLKYLKAGGRIKPSVASIAEILDIKPILIIADGLVESADKVRGRKKVIPKMLELAAQRGVDNAGEVWILYSDMPEKAEEFKTSFEEKFDVKVTGISYIGPTIGINTGGGAFALIFFGN